jgi:hypothetical protein
MANEQITIEVSAPSSAEAASICDFIAASMEKAGFEDVSTNSVKDTPTTPEAIDAMRRLNPDLATYPVYISINYNDSDDEEVVDESEAA